MQLELFSRPASAPTVAEYAERWLATHSAPPFVWPYTQSTRRAMLGHYVLPSLGDRPIASVCSRDLTELQLALLGRGLALGTVRTVLIAFGGLLRAAHRDGLLDLVPESPRWPRAEFREPDPYTVEEVDRLLAYVAAHDPDRHAFVALVMLAGLRPSEAAALRWSDIDTQRGTVRIVASLVNGERGAPKTPRSARTILVSARLRAILRRRAPDDGQDGPVVTQRNGRPLVTHRFGAHEMRRYCEALGIRRRGLYGGRRAYMSLAATAGANVAQLASYCGTGIRMLETHYVRYLGQLSDPMQTRKKRGHRGSR